MQISSYCSLLRISALWFIDWIGTTEQMQTITLPLLSYMLVQNFSSSLPAFNRMAHKAGLKRKDLSADTLRKLRELAPLDF
jgi:hypothetical protein